MDHVMLLVAHDRLKAVALLGYLLPRDDIHHVGRGNALAFAVVADSSSRY